MITRPHKLIPWPRLRLALLTAPSVHIRINSPFAPAKATIRRRSAGMSAQVSGHQCRKAPQADASARQAGQVRAVVHRDVGAHRALPGPRQQRGMTAPVVGSLADYLDEVYPADTGGTACHPGATAWRRLSYTPPLRPCRAKARTGGVAPPGVQPSPARSCPADVSASTARCGRARRALPCGLLLLMTATVLDVRRNRGEPQATPIAVTAISTRASLPASGTLNPDWPSAVRQPVTSS
jgi:hypothetical protein